MALKVQYIAFSFARGGAAIAARSMIAAASGFADVRAISVEKYIASDAEYTAPSSLGYVFHFFCRLIEHVLVRLLLGRSVVKQSLNIFSSRYVLNCMCRNASKGYISHVHWINNCTLSVFALRRLPERSVVSLHDEWLYIGTGSYDLSGVEGLEKTNSFKAFFESKLEKIKAKSLIGRDDITFTVPSRWMLERAQASAALKGKNVVLLPNIVDPEEFSQIDSSHLLELREKWGVPGSSVVVGFGAIDGSRNILKGFSYFEEALRKVSSATDAETDVVLLAFGAGTERYREIAGFSVVGLGHVSSRKDLNEIYGVCDFVTVPSLREAFGLTAAEALLSGRPVVSFKGTGVEDIVEHGVSGFLATHQNSDSLADSMLAMLSLSKAKRDEMGSFGRASTIAKCSPDVVAKNLLGIYKGARCVT